MPVPFRVFRLPGLRNKGTGISIIGGGGGGFGGGGGQIFIYSCSSFLISFEIDCFYSL